MCASHKVALYIENHVFHLLMCFVCARAGEVGVHDGESLGFYGVCFYAVRKRLRSKNMIYVRAYI